MSSRLELTWKYSTKHSPTAPVIWAEVAGTSLELVVDTGFAGGILIPFAFFRSFGLMSTLSPDGYRLVLPDSRRVPLYTSVDRVAMGEDSFMVEVHASPVVERRVAGRAFLRNFVCSLDGLKEELKISSP